MTRLAFVLEWRLAIVRRRLFVLNAVIPLLLVAPIAFSAAPTAHAAAVYAVLFTLFGTFGSAIPIVRDSDRGMIARIEGTRMGGADYLVGRALGGATVDTLQLLPATGIILAVSPGAGTVEMLVIPILFAVMVLTNIIGVWVASFARSLAEAALFSAVTGLLLLHISGTFRTPAPETLGSVLEAVSPFRALHEVLLSAGGIPVWQGGAPLAAWLALLLTITVGTAPHLMRHLAAGRVS